MKIEITYVPKGKEILEFLKEIKSQAPNAWFLLHNNAINHLYNDENGSVETYYIGPTNGWRLTRNIAKYHNGKMVDFIDFSTCNEPENIFFIDMEN